MQKRLEGFFLVLSAALIWLTNPPEVINSLLQVFGVRREGSLAIFLTGMTVGVGILGAQTVLHFLIERIVRPLFPDYLGGVWIYTLRRAPLSQADGPRRSTIGLFLLRRKDDKWVVEDGVAYVLNTDLPEPRGTWHATNVSANSELIEIFYRFLSHFEYRGNNYAEFDGIIRIRRSYSSGVLGVPYRGEFSSLRDDNPVRGAIYAEHVARFALAYEKTKARLLLCPLRVVERLQNY